MREFVHEAVPARVVSGAGSLDRVPAECGALGLRRVLVVAGGSATHAGDRVAAGLGEVCAGRFTEVAPHVPEQLAADAADAARAADADGLCCVGGGSATGLAKAVAVALDLPIVAVPTTYAGSEATPIYGITGVGKRTARDPRARPRTVVYDPLLTTDLPAAVSATSAFNALAHAVAALTGPAYEPVARLYAAEAVRLIRDALPAVVAGPHGPDVLAARGRLLWAAWLAGSGLAGTGAGLHHRLCHVLGGSFGLEHAAVHAVLLPHTMAYDDSLELSGLAAALGADDPVAALRGLARRVGVPAGLAALGLTRDQLPEAARQAAAAIGTHDPAWFRTLLDRAYSDHPERT